MAEFVLHVPDIDEAGKDFEFPVRAAWLVGVLEGTDVRSQPSAPEGRVTLHAQRQGVDIVVHGRVAATLVVDCARCLEPARVSVDTEIGALLTARRANLRPEPDELELTPEELSREFFTGDDVVLDDMVRENILLEIPLKPLCTVDCVGIAPQPVPADAVPDSTKGIDPRLAPLLKLAGKVPTKE